ncbi:MAG: SMP-30/gluconolactonase/LRE family protein [Bacteroidota bacterium]
MKRVPFYLILSLVLVQCTTDTESDSGKKYATTGSIERFDPFMDELIPKDAKVEIIASGFEWAEGPLWLTDQNALIFSDIPVNTIFKWTEKDSITEYLKPSGFSGSITGKKEPGSNGLALDKDGKLILCQHGDRQIGRMKAPLNRPKAEYETLVHAYNGLRLNSPNDLTVSSQGIIYFTDPPYGLDDWNIKELDFQGVYKLDLNGELTLLIDNLTRPNGIGLSPDEKTLYIAVSDPERAGYYAYQLDEDGNVSSGRLILDARNMYSNERQGNPDGMAISKAGYLFATGPGGVLVIDPEGKHLGTILTGQHTANCTFNEDESVLYITADMYLMRVKLK